MSMYSLIEYSHNYAKTLKSFCSIVEMRQMIIFLELESFNSNSRCANDTGSTGTLNEKIVVLLKYLINFCRTLKMALINCEITLDLTWLANCIIFEEDRAITFAIADAKLYVPVVTLINEDK